MIIRYNWCLNKEFEIIFHNKICNALSFNFTEIYQSILDNKGIQYTDVLFERQQLRSNFILYTTVS